MSQATLSPADFKKRSFVADRLAAAGARFLEVDGAAVAEAFDSEAREREIAGRCALADLSPLPRFGIKGQGGPAWLARQGVRVPEAMNVALRQADGALAARLSAGEVLVLGDPAAGPRCAELEEIWRGERVRDPVTPRGYPVPRADSHCWFRLAGGRVPEMFAKLCAVDLRAHKFPDLRVAQTSLARVAAIIVRDDLSGNLPSYHLLADSASARYLWDCLVDAMAEFDGKPVGLRTLRLLAAG